MVIPAIRKPSRPIFGNGMDPGLGQLDSTFDVTEVELLRMAAKDVEPLVACIV